MPVPHARDTAAASSDEKAAGEVPGLLEALGRVPDPRRRRGRRYALVFVLAVAVACALAGRGTSARPETMPLTCRRTSCWEHVDLDNAVVTADAVHAQRHRGVPRRA